MTRKRKENLKIFTLIFAALFSFFMLTTNVFANASTTSLKVTFRDGSEGKGKVQYSLDDGTTWSDIEQSMEAPININVTGNNLKLKIVARDDNTIDWAGIELNGAIVSDQKDALLSGDGYSVPSNVVNATLENIEFKAGEGNPDERPDLNTFSNVTVTISGEELEYDHDWSSDACDFVFGINTGEMRRLSKEEVNYVRENDKIVGLTTKQAINYQYDYNEGNVKFTIRTQWDDLYTSLKINDTEYPTPKTKNDLIAAYENGGISFEVTVPKADSYKIEIEGRKQNENEKIMGNFGWTYDPNTNEYSDDDKIEHGTLEFVKAVYNGTTYNSVEALNNAGKVFKWETHDPYGEASFAPGTEVTLKLTPDSGYQLTEFTLNGFPFETGDEIGVYTFTIGGGNWHLGAHFTKVNNEVDAKASRVDNGTVSNVDFQVGTAKLDVDNVASMSPQREEKFVDAADEYEIDNYLEISLYNTVYKGGKKDANNKYLSWDTEVNNLDKKATIELELNGDLDGNDVAIIHEKHLANGEVEYEVIDAQFDSATNKVTFETDSFSTYAIAVKEGSGDDGKETYTVKDDKGNSITFKEVPGREYELTIVDYMSYTKEEVMSMAEITSEQYDEVFNGVKEEVKSQGTLISIFEILVTDKIDEHNVEKGPFTIKIKMTDEMKKYNSFKLVYLNDDMKIEEVIILKKEGDYLVGTLKHLSNYVLVGSVVNNPETGDNIYHYFTLFFISLIGVCILPIRYYYLRKNY